VSFPYDIQDDFIETADGLLPVMIHLTPPVPPASPPGTPLPAMEWYYVDKALRRERTIISDAGTAADVVVFHIPGNALGGLEPTPGEVVVDTSGLAYVIMSGSSQTFSSRIKLTCRKPDTGTVRYRSWNTQAEFLDNLELYPPDIEYGEWVNPFPQAPLPPPP
jgi:hypothetical protein